MLKIFDFHTQGSTFVIFGQLLVFQVSYSATWRVIPQMLFNYLLHKLIFNYNTITIFTLFQKPKPEDQGTIKIVATNEHGEHSVQQNFQLKCIGKDIFKSVDSYFK